MINFQTFMCKSFYGLNIFPTKIIVFRKVWNKKKYNKFLNFFICKTFLWPKHFYLFKAQGNLALHSIYDYYQINKM